MSYVNALPPINFSSGSLLDPNDVNENVLYVSKHLNDAQDHRFEHSVLLLPFMSGTSAADNRECRSIRLPMINTMLLERAYFYFNGTGSVQIKLTKVDRPVGTDSDISSIANPILSAVGTDATVDNESIFTTQLLLNSGSTYRFELTGSSANSWAATRADVVLHLRADRLFTGSADHSIDRPLTMFTEDDFIGTAGYLKNVDNLLAMAQSNLSSSQQALKPMFISFRNVEPGASSSRYTQNIPVGKSDRTRMTAVRLSMFQVSTGSASSANAARYIFQNSNGITVDQMHLTMSSGQTGSYGEISFNHNMASTSSNPSTDVSKDWRVSIAATPANKLFRSYGYLWFK